MRSSRSCVLVILFAISVTLHVPAKEAHAPLPQQVLEAKTLYIDNQSGYANLGDRAYDELKKWGRYEIVDSADKADLILLLSASSYTGHYRTTGTNTTYGTIDNSGNVNVYGTQNSTTHPVTVNYTHLTLINPQTGTALWSDTKKWGWHSATRGLIKELEQRVQEQGAKSSK